MKDVIMLVDTGIDDAMAIVLSAFDWRTKLKGIVACSGNFDLNDVAHKTLQVVEFIKKDVPVFLGYDKNLSKKILTVTGVHGKKGKLGGFDFPEATSKAKSFEELILFFKGLTKKVDILCVSPLTTLAKLFLDYPEFKQKISCIYFQGGLLSNPNYVGFNVANDSKATEIILSSGVKLVVCPSDFGHNAFLSNQEIKKLKTMGKTGEMFEYIFRSYHDKDVGEKGVATHDGCVSFLIRHHAFFLQKKVHAFVEYNDDGFGILKFDFKKKPKNAYVCTKMFVPKFKRFVFNIIKKAK